MKTFLIIAGTAVATILVVVIGMKATSSHWRGHHGGQYYGDHAGPGFRGHGGGGYGHGMFGGGMGHGHMGGGGMGGGHMDGGHMDGARMHGAQMHDGNEGRGHMGGGRMFGGRMAGHGMGRHMAFGGAGYSCQGGGLDRIESVVENFVSFTPEQDAAWKDLSAAMRAAHAERQAACETMRADAMGGGTMHEGAKDGEARPAMATDRFARMEARLESRLTAVRKIRPALDAFRATLNEGQRKTLDDLMDRHR